MTERKHGHYWFDLQGHAYADIADTAERWTEMLIEDAGRNDK